MESPAINPESPMDQEDIPYPCKGCGEILEEGKAFELAGNRWHIDCFRCNTCNTLLDSDAHLLLLGDGSLICSNCTYSCSSCGNKIEDLAILTGDQAFCANCFKCRNCKRRIENLRYARTSQGIFCMDCHESLMQRRRKKKTAAKKLNFDKSLPSLPPSFEEERNSGEIETPPLREYSASPDVSHNRPAEQRVSIYSRVDAASPAPQPEQPQNQDNLILPSSAYRPSSHNRHSTVSTTRSEVDAGDEFLIPVAFDPTPDERPSPHVNVQEETRAAPRDYFGDVRPPAGSRQASSDRSGTPQQSAAHIAFQEKGRQPVSSDSSQWRQDPSPKTAQVKTETKDNFKLQEAPKGRKSSSTESSKSDLNAAKESTSLSSTSSPSAAITSPPEPLKAPHIASQKLEATPPSTSTPPGRSSHEFREPPQNGPTDSSKAVAAGTIPFPPKRGDSLEHYVTSQIQRKDIGSAPKALVQNEQKANGEVAGPEKNESQVPTDMPPPLSHPPAPPSVQPNREELTDLSKAIAPEERRTRNDSVATFQSEISRADFSAPSLLRYSGGADFSMDEDLLRILGSEALAQQEPSESFMKRVSNSVRHGRSFSDKGSRLSRDSKWPKSPANGGAFPPEITSPVASSPEQREDITALKSELRRERQRLIEKDQKIAELQKTLNAQADVKQADSELREKRSTMVVLDTRKEVVLRELASITEHLEKEKHGSAPMDLAKLTNNVVRSFAEKLQGLKDSFAPQIEELMQQRTTLATEIANLSRLKEKSFQEFEQLSSKNAQLAELNNQLVNQIQGIYNANSTVDSSRSTNGLGIYSHNKDKSTGSIDATKTGELATSVSTMTIHDEAEPATIVPGPQVVSIRKGQPRKFNWKRGGQTVAKGVTKGLKGAFSSDKEFGPDGTVQHVDASPMPRSQTQETRFGFFGNQKRQAAWKTQQNGSSQGLSDAAVGQSETLFGVELEQRLEQEKSIIPAVVTRCIQEVELRGMDEEGIYRKSGAASVTQIIREGFEGANDYDISDPDLDIHAVTSALKQYFRKLPTPLITWHSYDLVLETNDITPQSARIEKLRAALDTLPRVHRDVLEFLVFHLKRVVEHEKENLMTSQNVAVVFAPTIMWPQDIAREMTDVQRKTESLKFIVENCQEIFM